jgi:MarR family transcriptional regulator, lower aerobic nicotinate degradation pathway regulator
VKTVAKCNHCGMPVSAVSRRPASLTRYATYLATQVAKAAQRPLTDGLADQALRPPHFAVLCAVHDGGPLTQQQLADQLDIDKSHMVGFVDELDDRGLVERRKDPSDRRCHQIHLTPQGRVLLPELHRAAEHADAAAHEALSPAELDQLRSLLERVLAVTDRGRTLPG